MKSMSTELLTVTLTPAELSIGSTVGLQRQLKCLQNSRVGKSLKDYKEYWGNPGAKGLWGNSIEGALGEIAVAKYLGVYPSGISGYDSTDVGEHYEVRTRPHPRDILFMKKRDKKDKYYILVIGSYGIYQLKGWVSAPEVFAHEEWYHNNNGRTSTSYWVPDEALHDIRTLPEDLCHLQEINKMFLQNSLENTRTIPYNSLEIS
ncbi:MAG: hypothetical protein Unbinned2902contig1001_18 [Prokaryotic dsDNA virus sp.]|nr:MAG: hypothetical protein Unbinned2902contig1001_18 [Prokaryotic dsDNA virus sp.]